MGSLVNTQMLPTPTATAILVLFGCSKALTHAAIKSASKEIERDSASTTSSQSATVAVMLNTRTAVPTNSPTSDEKYRVQTPTDGAQRRSKEQ